MHKNKTCKYHNEYLKRFVKSPYTYYEKYINNLYTKGDYWRYNNIFFFVILFVNNYLTNKRRKNIQASYVRKK